MALTAETVYADLLESTFDIHRHLLYKALRFPLPQKPAQEINDGKRLTEYLWRGLNENQTMPDFEEPSNSSE